MARLQKELTNLKTLGISLGALILLSLIFTALGSSSTASTGSSATVNGSLAQTGGAALGGNFVADKLSKIAVIARLMPSQMSQDNKIQMDYHTNSDEGHSGEEYFSSDKKDDIGSDHFSIANTEGYFPSVKMTDDYMPLGSGKPVCLHFEWIPKDK